MTAAPTALKDFSPAGFSPQGEFSESSPRKLGGVHLVGCCGSGMKGLVDLLISSGFRVSGSDMAPPCDRLLKWTTSGFQFRPGHAANHIPPEASLVIYSQAIPPENPERREAVRRGLPQLTYSQMLGQLMTSRQGMCIAGTHGKSTTTAMTAWILKSAGWDPSAIFGADLIDSESNSWAGSGPLFVVESCEFQRSFLDLSPKSAAILSVEADHFDYFDTEEEMQSAYSEFAAKIPQDGFLLIPHHGEVEAQIATSTAATVLTFGTTSDADWWASDFRPNGTGMQFRLFRRGQFVTEIDLPRPGRHNAVNALVAAALSAELGVSGTSIRSALQQFPGLRRRFEFIGSWRGVTVISDYAHHPTAVKATLQTARDLYPTRPIRVAFQPHQVSRTRALFSDFSESFSCADEVFVAPVYAARERVNREPFILSQELTRAISGSGVRARAAVSLDHLQQVVDDALKPGDVFLIMGAGDIDRIQHAFTRRLPRDSATQRAAGSHDVAESGRTSSVFSHAATC